MASSGELHSEAFAVAENFQSTAEPKPAYVTTLAGDGELGVSSRDSNSFRPSSTQLAE